MRWPVEGEAVQYCTVRPRRGVCPAPSNLGPPRSAPVISATFLFVSWPRPPLGGRAGRRPAARARRARAPPRPPRAPRNGAPTACRWRGRGRRRGRAAACAAAAGVGAPRRRRRRRPPTATRRLPWRRRHRRRGGGRAGRAGRAGLLRRPLSPQAAPPVGELAAGRPRRRLERSAHAHPSGHHRAPGGPLACGRTPPKRCALPLFTCTTTNKQSARWDPWGTRPPPQKHPISRAYTPQVQGKGQGAHTDAAHGGRHPATTARTRRGPQHAARFAGRRWCARVWHGVSIVRVPPSNSRGGSASRPTATRRAAAATAPRRRGAHPEVTTTRERLPPPPPHNGLSLPHAELPCAWCPGNPGGPRTPRAPVLGRPATAPDPAVTPSRLAPRAARAWRPTRSNGGSSRQGAAQQNAEQLA